MKNKSNLAKQRKEELLILLLQTNDLDLQNSIVKQILLLAKKFNLKRTKDEKTIYCRKCANIYNKKTKIRIESIKKSKEKKMQKIIICGNCNAIQKISL